MWTREDSKKWIRKTCGTGWLDLVDEVYDNLPSDLGINQAYQKWGSLMFDLEKENEAFERFLEVIEEKSSKTCEKCGSVGEEVSIDGWIHTRCKNHSKKT